MISARNVSLQFGGRPLFEHVDIQFTNGNCYGLIGANGTGKSTFLRILSGELEPNKGEISVTPGERIAVLRQDHYAFDQYTVMETVIMGYDRLHEIMQLKEELYAKPDFDDADGIRLAELEGEFAELDGWSAESDVEILLNGLGLPAETHHQTMAELDGPSKVKVLLAQALPALRPVPRGSPARNGRSSPSAGPPGAAA